MTESQLLFKENMMDPLRMELSRLLRQAQNQATSNKAMNDIYAFQKRNPDYNMDNVLGEQSKYITLFVKRKLEMMAWNEGEHYIIYFIILYMIKITYI